MRVFLPLAAAAPALTGAAFAPTASVAKGCALGKVGCKSQTWVRVTDADR